MTASGSATPAGTSPTASLLLGELDAAAGGAGGQAGGKGAGHDGASAGSADAAAALAAQTGDPAATGPTFAPVLDDSAAASQIAAAAASGSAAATATGAPEGSAPSRTVAGLASQIVQNLDSKITRFDVALDPEGLGRVNVSVEISAKGEMSARLSFEHPEAANAMASESVALRQSLQDAGFQLKAEDLTFQSGGQSGAGGFAGGGSGAFDDGQRPSGGGAAAFSAMNRLADLTDLSAMGAASGAAARGLDIRI